MNRWQFAVILIAAGLANAPAVADELTVYSVFAPGSGGNYVREGETPPGTATQRQMYADLPDALDNLDRQSLDLYFKPAVFDVAPADMASVTRLRPGVRIVRDKVHNIPHVYGETRADAMFGVGYVRAEDRLWQMETFRARWRADTATLLGRGEDDANIRQDAATYRLIDYSEAEYQAMFDRLRTNYGYWGRQAAEDLEEYIAGMNAYLAEIERDRSRLPVEFVNRGLAPKPWTVTDAMAMAAYSHVSWGSAGPGEEANAELLQQLRARFGVEAEAIYADLRNAPDDATQHSLPPVAGETGRSEPASIALPDLHSFAARRIATIEAATVPAASATHRPRDVRSNALLVAAAHSATGHPIAVQGPQDGYGTPHLFDSEIVIVAPDFRARGVLELSGPYPYVAARGDGYAWSITILPPDQADTFVEVLCEPDGSPATPQSTHYRYRDECISLIARTDTKMLPDGASYALTSLRSVHGPVIGSATVDGMPVVLAQARTMYLHEEMDYPAHARLFSPSVVRSAQDFIEIVAGTAYNIGWWYVDNNDIAAVDAGLVPVRRPGAATDLPVWGDGRWDWVGFDPATYTFRTPLRSQYPQAINGPAGVLAGWNNPSAAGWPLKDEDWNFSAGNRMQLLREPTLAAVRRGPITIAELLRLHTTAAITDYHAQRVYPVLRRFLGPLDDSRVEIALLDADRWVDDGALLRDRDGDGFLEHGAAVSLLEEFWPVLVQLAYEPLLGGEILSAAGIGNNLPSLQPAPDEANAWVMRILAGVRQHAGETGEAYSRNYCGTTAADCRQLLAKAFREAAAATARKHGGDVAGWQVPATCTRGCRQIEFTPTGDMPPVAPIAWQNRGTYIQVTTGENSNGSTVP